MKKVLSFCVLSVLLAVLSLGLKAQSGLVLTPANLPSPLPLNQFDTIYLSTDPSCFDQLGLGAVNAPISIEWQVLYNGSVIPDDSLSFYFEEFKLESRYDLGNAERWWGRTYVSNYCQNGNGYGTYPGANTPIANAQDGHACSDPGHFAIALSQHTSPYQYDYFYTRWFTSSQTAHRLVYNIKIDGDYQFVFSLAKRCGNLEPWTTFTMKNPDGTYMQGDGTYIGGHESMLCEIVSSDTTRGYVVTDITDYYRCVGDSLVLGDPAVTFKVSTDTTIDPGYDSVFYMNSSSCGAGIDSIVRFRVFFEDPATPVLDTLGSILTLCDSGMVAIKATLTNADMCIWFDETRTVLDTLNVTDTLKQRVNANTTFYALGYNSASGCTSSDSLSVKVEVFASPRPVVSVTDTAVCENGEFTISLDQVYDKWNWFHNGDSMNLDTIAYHVADADTTDTGYYWAEVSMNHVHSLYTTVDTISCSAADTVQVTVFPRPNAHWVSLDGGDVVDSTMFCPSDLHHVLVAAVTDGQPVYKGFSRITNSLPNTAYQFSYNSNRDTVTITVDLPEDCDESYRLGIKTLKDDHGCTLKSALPITLFVNDTIDPTVVKTKDTISAPAYANCEYIIPDVMGIIAVADSCGIDTVIQSPAAGQLVTVDTFVVVTVTDLCGRTATDTIEVRLPVEPLAIDTIVVTQQVLCAGSDNGAISVTVKGGLAPYDVHIQSLKVVDSVKNAHSVDTVFAFTGLIEGKWVVTVTDTNGCTTAEDTINVAAPAMLTLVSDSLSNLTCFESNDGFFNFRVQQGTAPYDVKIVRTLGNVIDSVEMSLNSERLDTLVPMTDQKAGVYVITVVDGNGCTATVTDTLTQPDQLVLVGDTVLAHILCFGDSIGQLAVTGVTGGTYPYHYAWVNENLDTVSTDSVTSATLKAGFYTIYVTDTNGCTADRSITDTIKQPEAALALVSDSLVNLSCFESNDGSFRFNVKDGTKPYTVKIHRTFENDIEDTTLTLNPVVSDTTVKWAGLKAGYYFISVVDANGCVTDTICDTITQPDQLMLLGVDTINDVKCFGDANGQLAVTGVTGGTMPYVFEWRYADNDSVVSNDSITGRILTVGDYKIYITDANNCAPNDTITATISGPDTTLTVMSLVAPVNDTCPHLGSYVFSAEVKGGRTDYNFVWTFNLDTVLDHVASELVDTFTYNETVVSCDTTFDIVFTVTDDSACVASKNITFSIQDTLKPTISGTIDTVYLNACVTAAIPDSLKFNTIERLTAYGITISDNCTPNDLLQVNYSDTVIGKCPYEVVRKYSVTDRCGHTSDTLVQIIYVQDTTKPEFTTLPVNDTVYCDGSNWTIPDEYADFISTKAGAVATDNCTLDSITMVLLDSVQGCNRTTMTYFYEFTAYDQCMNTTKAYADFYVIDLLKPRFIGRPNDTIKYECFLADTTAAREDALAQFRWTDDCDTAYLKASYLGDFVKGCGGPTGFYKHYVVITDGCNEDTTSHIIAIVDSKIPSISQPWTNPIVPCDGAGNHEQLFAFLYDSIRVSDDCSGVESVTVYIGTNTATPFDTSANALIDGIHFQGWEWDNPNDPTCSGHYTFTWEVRDSCGNPNSTTENFYIRDEQKPLFSLTRNDTIVDCGFDQNDFDAWLTLPKSFDLCARDSFDVTYTKQWDLDCGAQGTWRVTWRTQDNCGNVNETYAKWNVVDNEAPDLQTLNNGQLANDTIYFKPEAPYIDDIVGYPDNSWHKTLMNAQQSADFIDALLTDGNIYDNNNRVHHFRNAAGGIQAVIECGYVKDFHFINDNPSPTAEGSCAVNLIVKYVFGDACGNEREFSQTIVILDTSAPKMADFEDVAYFRGPDDGCVKIPFDTFRTVGALNAHIPSVGLDANAVDQNLNLTDEGYVILDSVVNSYNPTSPCDSMEVRYYTIKDNCGNETSFTQTIVYEDTVAPQLNITEMFDSIHQLADDCSKYAEVEAGLFDSLKVETWLYDHYGLYISDCHNHKINFLEETEETDANYCPGKVFVRRYEVVKDCGYYPVNKNRRSYFNVRLVVKDTVAPVIIPQTNANIKDTVLYFDASCQFALPDLNLTTYKQMKDWAGRDVYDDCKMSDDADVQVVGIVTSGNKCDSVITYKYIAADSCGNWSRDTVTITVEVLDTLAPEITVANATVVDTQYYEDNCDMPVLNKWVTPQDAWDAGVRFTDCNLVMDDASKLIVQDSVSVRNVCTITYTVSYKVKDACSDRLSEPIYQTIVILDTVAPVAGTIKDTATYMTDDNDVCWGPAVPYFSTVADVKAYDATFTVQDCNVGDNSVVEMVRYDSSAIVSCERTIVRYYVVYDSCGKRSNEFSHTIMVRDTSAPVITGILTPQEVEMTEDCGFTYNLYTRVSDLEANTNVTIADCNLVDTLYSVVDTLATAYIDACDKAYTLYISYEVKDSCNHTTSFYDTVYVADVTAPKVEGRLDTIALYLSDVCAYTVPAAFTSVDSVLAHYPNLSITDCKLVDTITVSVIDTASFGCPMLIHRSYTVKDSCGHATLFDQFYEVYDTLAPSVTNLVLTNDTVYINENGEYLAALPNAFTTADQLNNPRPGVVGAGIEDCNLVQEVNSSIEIPTINSAVCDGSYITRKYTVRDSCMYNGKVSDTITHTIVLMDTIKPVMTNMPDTVWATLIAPCTFQVPDLTDTVKNHYHDNWAMPFADSYFLNQIPAPGTTLVNPKDTFVVVTFQDACGNTNTDTVRIINWADTVAPQPILPNTLDAAFAGNCTFVVPNLTDTVKNHYADMWNASTTTGLETYDTCWQVPAANAQVLHFTDTVVTVSFRDVCGNTDSVRIAIVVPDSLYVGVTMDSVLCNGGNTGKIYMTVHGGTSDFTYAYVGDTITTSLTDTLFQNVAAGSYLVTVSDSYQCYDTATIVVEQPAAITYTAVADYRENCLNRDTTEVALIMEGGTPNYTMFATLLAADYSELMDTVFYRTNVVRATDTVKINPIRDTLYVAYYGEDYHHCSISDTSEIIIVHPIYVFEQTGRVCYTEAHANGYHWYDADGNHRKDYPASVFTGADSTYVLYDSLTTIPYGCDSVYVMYLRVEDIPYLKVRPIPTNWDPNDISDAVEHVDTACFTTASRNVGWEVFVDKNCMDCKTNIPVSLSYDLYRLDESTNTYQLMSQVTNYFQPKYRTFFDEFTLGYTGSAANHISIPDLYPQTGTTQHPVDYNYFNLCWLDPDYDESVTPLPANHYHTNSGDFYQDGRANTILIEGFGSDVHNGSGDYKIVVTLNKCSGTITPDNYYTWALNLNVEVGGNIAVNSLVLEPFASTEICFHVDESSSPVIHMPTTDPIGGNVVYSSNKDVEASANVYPNPARDYVQVELSGFEGKTEVVLSSSAGKVLQTIKLDIADTQSTPIVKIETGDYAQGIYLVTARNKETIITKRVVLIR